MTPTNVELCLVDQPKGKSIFVALDRVIYIFLFVYMINVTPVGDSLGVWGYRTSLHNGVPSIKR